MISTANTVLSHEKRVRRVVILCQEFMRNSAYFEASKVYDWDAIIPARTSDANFWRTARSNCLDKCVEEWCKLFGGPREAQGWQKVVSDEGKFKAGLLAHLNMTAEQFEDLRKAMRKYRDKFLAHLDSEEKYYIPFQEKAREAVEYYHRYILEEESNGCSMLGLPDTPMKMTRGYDQAMQEATIAFDTAGLPKK